MHFLSGIFFSFGSGMTSSYLCFQFQFCTLTNSLLVHWNTCPNSITTISSLFFFCVLEHCCNCMYLHKLFVWILLTVLMNISESLLNMLIYIFSINQITLTHSCLLEFFACPCYSCIIVQLICFSFERWSGWYHHPSFFCSFIELFVHSFCFYFHSFVYINIIFY